MLRCMMQLLKVSSEYPVCNHNHIQQKQRTHMTKQLINPNSMMYLIPHIHECKIIHIPKENDLKHVGQYRE